MAVHYDLFKELYDKQCELRQLTDEALLVVSLMHTVRPYSQRHGVNQQHNDKPGGFKPTAAL